MPDAMFSDGCIASTVAEPAVSLGGIGGGLMYTASLLNRGDGHRCPPGETPADAPPWGHSCFFLNLEPPLRQYDRGAP